MLQKSTVIKAITNLPDQFSIDELVEKMILLDKIEKGIKQADSNQVISEEELNREIEKWSK
jgi:hypothetical protein